MRTGSFEQSSPLVSSKWVSEMDAPIHVFAIKSGLDSGEPFPETRRSLSMSVATDDDDLTMTASYRFKTTPRLSTSLTRRKHTPVEPCVVANDGDAKLEPIATTRMNLCIERSVTFRAMSAIGR